MTEFTHGIQGAIKKLITGSSVGLALIYTLGHICIAMTVVTLLTGASLFEAGAVALIEPSINGVWFYLLHKIWFRMFMKNGIVESGMLSSINSSVLSPKGRYSKKENQEV